MQAIRIEYPLTGRGMFRTIGEQPNLDDLELYQVVDRHCKIPTPRNDPWSHKYYGDFSRDNWSFIREDEYCAFKSIEQLNKWIFPEEFQILFEAGYVVYLLELTKALELESQILYEKENIVSKTDISSLFVTTKI